MLNILFSIFAVFGLLGTDIEYKQTSEVVITATEEVSLLDLSDYYAGDEKMREEFVAQFGDALHRIGFVRLKNHGISQKMIDEAYASANQFFDLPADAKMRYQGLQMNRGYKRYNPDRMDKVSDLQEYWHVGPLNENVWPEEIGGFEENLSKLYREIAWHGEPILETCSLYMGKEADFLSHLTANGDSIMRVIHYLPNQSETTTWKSANQDPNLLTIIVGASKEGLQVQTREGEWIDIPADPDTIIVSASNMLESLSNGLIRSAPHRVVITQSETSRYSIPFFFHVERTQSIAPQEESIEKTGGIALYPDQTAGEALKERNWFK